MHTPTGLKEGHNLFQSAYTKLIHNIKQCVHMPLILLLRFICVIISVFKRLAFPAGLDFYIERHLLHTFSEVLQPL